MTVNGLMASIPLHLPVRHRHSQLRAPSGGLHPAAADEPRWVQEGEAGICWGSEVVG